MMEKREKSGFWGGLLRSRGLARRGPALVRNTAVSSRERAVRRADRWPKEPGQARRPGDGGDDGDDGDGGLLPHRRRRRTVSGSDEVARPSPRSTKRRVLTPVPELAQVTTGKGRRSVSRKVSNNHDDDDGNDDENDDDDDDENEAITSSSSNKPASGDEDGVPSVRTRAHSLAPSTRWPPTSISNREELPQQDALELIARGAPAHSGRKKSIPHASDQHYALYATTTASGSLGGAGDAVNLHDAMAQLMTMRLQGQGHASYPWETLEQPSCSFLYGQRPGTITLNQWAATASSVPPKVALRDSGVLPRAVGLEQIFARLKDLQAGLEDDDLSLLYRNLYKRLLRDPDKLLSPHKTLDKQITDLIMVLSRQGWIDFTDLKNQVVTRFIFEKTQEEQYQKFFHQLLLSLELELRIHSRHHGDWAKERLLRQMPPTIKWNLALARRWRENVRVESYGDSPEQIKLRYKLKKRQVKYLKKFAQMMKWPNLRETLDNLRQRDEDFTLDSISSDAFAFFSGLVLPGATFPFLIMNTLIDVDPDQATDDLALLSHMYPNCGFQYRNSHTYWSASCIVGKVLAPTCHSVAGWVGPGRPTADLGRSQIARIRTRRARQRMGREDVESMGERSDALGPPAEAYPVAEYKLPVLDDGSGVVDTVRMEMLSFKPVAATAREGDGAGPRLFDAKLQFAIDGVSWPLRLMHDVSFISAWPCSDGPHPLFYDYIYQVAKADEVMKVRNWGGTDGAQQHASGHNSAGSSPAPEALKTGADGSEHDDEKVLIVNAMGVRDNEVLARAWCSHWGLGAVVADIGKTCMACAIREAYAATLTVVILVEGQLHDDDE